MDGHQLENHPGSVEDNMTKVAAGPSENPDSNAELVRDIEESGYPVDGATEQFVPQPDGLSVERPGFPSVQVDNAQSISITPTENKSTSRGDVDEQGHGADIA
jgi:hypothetical protein